MLSAKMHPKCLQWTSLRRGWQDVLLTVIAQRLAGRLADSHVTLTR